MKKILLSTLVLSIPLNTMAADILGFQVGGGSWSHTPSGEITSSVGGTGTKADLANDLQLGKKSEGYAYAILEHPVPAVPNIKITQTTLSSAGSGAVTGAFTFNGTSYSVSQNVTSTLSLNQTDTTLYYELLDNVVSLDVGLNAKTIKGEATVNTNTSSFSATVPMLYVAAEVAFPTTGLAIGVDMSTITASGNTLSDMTAKISYTTDFMLGVEAGVRTQAYKIDVDSVVADMKFSGAFVGAYFKF